MSGIGHLGIGLAAKRTALKILLVALLLAPMLLDIIWVAFSFAGIEHNIWSHGLYPDVPLENVKATMDAMEKYAFYYG